MSVTLRAIEESDLENIMHWRMDEDVTRYMNTNPKLTLEGQRKWLAGIRENRDVQYWVIEVDGEPAGVFNLTGLLKEDGRIGWAYYVGVKRLRSMMTAISLEMSMYDYAFDVLDKNAVVGDVFVLNKGVIQLHKLCGCEISQPRVNAVCKEGIWYDVVDTVMTAERWNEVRATKKYEKIMFA